MLVKMKLCGNIVYDGIEFRYSNNQEWYFLGNEPLWL